jgi:hypothetical protein
VACTPASVRPATVSATAGVRSTVLKAESELALDRPQPRLRRPPGEPAAVVPEVESHTHERPVIPRGVTGRRAIGTTCRRPAPCGALRRLVGRRGRR